MRLSGASTTPYDRFSMTDPRLTQTEFPSHEISGQESCAMSVRKASPPAPDGPRLTGFVAATGTMRVIKGVCLRSFSGPGGMWPKTVGCPARVEIRRG
jgi:hypothetical protein